MPKRPHYAAFTLVELMVVIGIIAVLFSMLLPALNRAREQAKSIQCAANMRSILQAFQIYSQANNDMMPIPSERGESITSSVPSSFSLSFSCPILTPGGIIDYKLGALNQYLGPTPESRQRVMNCPSDNEDDRLVGSGTTLAPRNFSYSFNYYLRGFGSGPKTNYKYTGCRSFSIVHPAQKVLVFEEQWPNDATCWIPVYDTADVPALRHIGRCNMGFADGHVDSYLPIDFGVVEDGATASFTNKPLTDQFCNLFIP